MYILLKSPRSFTRISSKNLSSRHISWKRGRYFRLLLWYIPDWGKFSLKLIIWSLKCRNCVIDYMHNECWLFGDRLGSKHDVIYYSVFEQTDAMSGIVLDAISGVENLTFIIPAINFTTLAFHPSFYQTQDWNMMGNFCI